jgi:hypothetical protein
MATRPKRPTLIEAEAEAWLERLTVEPESLKPFLAWRAEAANAEVFDRLAVDRFPIWDAERERIFAQLETIPCAQEDERNPLLDRMVELEKLILLTRGTALRAVQAKANVLHYLRWEQNDEETPAMEDIRTFVENVARAERKKSA